jgi:O-antigen/teichoic acid export membrane protein
MKLATKVAYNTIIQTVSKVIATVLGLAAIAVITRYLGQTGFGQFTAITTFLTFFGIIVDFGLTLVTVQLISQPQADEKKILGNLFALRFISAALILGLAPLIIWLLPYDIDIKNGVAISALAFLFISLNQILVGVFQKNLRMDKVAIAEVTSRLVMFGGMIAAVRMNWGLNGVLAITVLANGISFVLHYYFARTFCIIKWQFDLSYWKYIFNKAWPLAITIILNLIYLKTDVLLLSLLPRPSELGIIAETGLYGAAYKVVDVLITLPFMFAGIVLPILTARWATGDKKSFHGVLQRSFDVMMILAVPLVIGTQVLAVPIMTAVAGPEFALSGKILRLLILAAGFIYLGNIFAHAIIAIDRQKRIIPAYLFTAVTALIGYIVLIPSFSVFGAAWVTIYSEIAIALASIWLIWKYTGFIPGFTVTVKSLLASIVMVASLYALNQFGLNNLALLIATAVIIYFLSLLIFKGLSREDISSLLKVK